MIKIPTKPTQKSRLEKSKYEYFIKMKDCKNKYTS